MRKGLVAPTRHAQTPTIVAANGVTAAPATLIAVKVVYRGRVHQEEEEKEEEGVLPLRAVAVSVPR